MQYGFGDQKEEGQGYSSIPPLLLGRSGGFYALYGLQSKEEHEHEHEN
jgi:hypothetical protein